MARVTGTQGNDDLLGTQGADLINALAGNDRILADLTTFCFERQMRADR